MARSLLGSEPLGLLPLRLQPEFHKAADPHLFRPATAGRKLGRLQLVRSAPQLPSFLESLRASDARRQAAGVFERRVGRRVRLLKVVVVIAHFFAFNPISTSRRMASARPSHA
jgi:hypothetical protein